MRFLVGYFPYVAGLSLLLAATVWIYMRGYSSCVSDQNLKLIKEEKNHVRIEQKVMRLSDSELDKRLCAKWMRDPCKHL